MECRYGRANDRLLGTWVIDAESFKEMDEYKNASEEERQRMTAMLPLLKMELTFTSDKVKMDMNLLGNAVNEEAGYTVKSSQGDKLVLEATDKEGKRDQIEAEVRGDLLVFHKDGQSFALKRK